MLPLGCKSDLRSVAVQEMEKMEHDRVWSLSARGMHTALTSTFIDYPVFVCRVPDCGLINKLCDELGLKSCMRIKVKNRERERERMASF